MPGVMKMPGCVFAGRLVAAADMPAGETEPKMDPLSVSLKAFLATLRRLRLHLPNLIEMGATARHPARS
jgi:hypothetical protein